MTLGRAVVGAAHRLRLACPTPDQLASTVTRLVEDRVASRLAARDASLWGPDAEAEARQRLGWVDLAETSRGLVAEIEALRDRLRADGVDRVVLCGMGGSSLAPEVICAAAGVPLTVLDSSHPDFVRAAVEGDLTRTVVVVSSKSGGTVETDSQRRVFEQAFDHAGIDAAERLVVVTDPGSPLASIAAEAGYRTFLADPEVGGRYSALSAFGLVPSGLAGADIATLLDEASRIRPALDLDAPDNPALQLGGMVGLASRQGADKLLLAAGGARYAGLGDWAEQLIAESTGKQGRGVLPVMIGETSASAPVPGPTDTALALYGPAELDEQLVPASGWAVGVDAPLGAQFLLWEHATAIAGRILEINPFDQPDVESAKQAARQMLDGATDRARPVFDDAGIQVFAPGDWLPATTSSAQTALAALFEQLPDRGYLAVQAYLDRHRDARLAQVRPRLARRLGRPVTFGWGPRFLHSTGQYHKGGPATGVFLQITGAVSADLTIPGSDFTFGDFIAAQAQGDAEVLAGRGCPVLRLHVDDPAAVDRIRELLW